jgi:hypothetical protein
MVIATTTQQSFFDYFLVFNSFDDTIYLSDEQGLVLMPTMQYYSCQHFAAPASSATKMCSSIIAQIGVVVVCKMVRPTLLAKRLIEAGRHLKLSDRE